MYREEANRVLSVLTVPKNIEDYEVYLEELAYL